jgi:hypothetical protein
MQLNESLAAKVWVLTYVSPEELSIENKGFSTALT